MNVTVVVVEAAAAAVVVVLEATVAVEVVGVVVDSGIIVADSGHSSRRCRSSGRKWYC